MTEYDVVINGGGPVGMGLAIELGQRGIRTAVIERFREPSPIPKGQNLTQRTAEHFHFWGCEKELRAAHPLPKDAGIGGMTTYGQLLSDYHYDWLNRAHVRDYYYCANARLPQYATERVLRTRAGEIDEIEVHYGLKGRDLTLHDDGAELVAEPEGGGVPVVFRGKYLVGCDGSRSFMRGAAGLGETLSDHNRLMALLVFRSPELHELLKRYPGKAFYNVLHPDFEGYWQFFGRVDYGLSWFFHAPVPFGTTAENYDFRAMLHRAVGQPFELEFEHIGLWDLRVSIADSYRNGRAFIAGDAAHSHPPYGGYGINTGFEDVRNLGWKIEAMLRGWGGPGLLDSYDAERRPVFASTARDFIERFIEEDRAFLERYSPERDRAEFEEAWNSRNLDADEVLAFEPNYAGSPIVGGEGRPSAKGRHEHLARAGHHLSPRVLPGGANTFEALGSGFTVFSERGEACAAFEAAAAFIGAPLKAVPVEAGALAEAYGAETVLVRPDQFVAWAGGGRPDAGRILDVSLGRAG